MNLFNKLESEYETIQKSLCTINDNIKKLTGKDLNGRSFEDEQNRHRGYSFNSGSKRRLKDYDESLNNNKNEANDDHYDDNYNDHSKQSKLQSRIVATSWELKHREQVLEEQKNDKKSMSRNRRMFSHIIGTLEKFKNEQTHRKDLQKRAEIEQKLDQAAEREREQLKIEREKLFKERKLKRIQMKCLELKLQRAEIHKEWEQSQQHLGNFIETKTKPHIFYMPLKHTKETLKRSQETKDKYRIIFAEKRAKIQKELNEIDELYRSTNDDSIDDLQTIENQSNNDDNKISKNLDRNDDSLIHRKNGHIDPNESKNDQSKMNDKQQIVEPEEKISKIFKPESKSEDSKKSGHNNHENHNQHSPTHSDHQSSSMVDEGLNESEKKLIDKEDFEPDYD